MNWLNWMKIWSKIGKTRLIKWSKLSHWSVNNGSKWNTESLAKYPTISCTAFGWNNMTKFGNYKILADRFVLNLKMWKNSRCHFSYWYSSVGHEVRRNCLAPWSTCDKGLLEVFVNISIFLQGKVFITTPQTILVVLPINEITKTRLEP